jgi:hypothetical protein
VLSCAVPAFAFAQSYPAPTFNALTLQNPLSVASGGTGAATLTSAFDNAYCSTIGYMLVRYTGVWTCAKGTPANPVWWGADPTGGTSSTAAFNSAMVASSYVFMPPGTFLFSTAPNTLPVGEKIIGSGVGSTVISSPLTSGNLFTLSNYDEIEDLQFTTTTTRTGGAFIATNGASYVQLSDLLMADWWTGIDINGVGATGIHMRDIWLLDGVAGGTPGNAGILVASTSNSVDITGNDIWVTGTNSGSQPYSGVEIQNAGDITLDHVSTVYTGSGLRLDPPAGQIDQAVFVTNSFFDSGSGFGIYSGPTGGGIVQLLKVSNSWAATNAAGGVVLVTTSGGQNQQIDLTNDVLSNNGGPGVLLNDTGTTGLKVLGSTLSANTNGILINAAATNFDIIGNTIGASGEFAANSAYGLSIASSANDYVVSDNRILGNTSGQVIYGTIPASFKGRIVNNIGYNPIGNVAAPSFPSSGTAIQNPLPYPVTVYLSGGTVTSVSIAGTATYGNAVAYPLQPGQTIAVTYTGSPTWLWFGN